MAGNDNFDPLNPKRPGTNDEGYYDATHPPPPDVPNPYHIGITVTDMGDPLPPDPKVPAATNLARESVRRIYDTMRQEGTPRLIAWVASALWGSFQLIAAGLSTAIAYGLAAVAPPIAIVFLKAITETRKALDPALPKLASEVLSELTGAEITTDHIPTGHGFKDHLSRVTAVGSEVHDLLEREFTPDGTLSPEQGAQAARAFTGFNVNFGIGTAMLGILGEIESLGAIENIRELGVDVAQNLGLGRLHRMALLPLIQTVIADPYQDFLNRKHRPKRLNVNQAILAFFREAMKDEDMRKELGLAGYSEERINLLLADARPRLSVANITELYFRGYFSEQTLKQELGHLGWQDYQIDALITMQRPQLGKGEILNLYQFGEIGYEETVAKLGQLGYDSATAALVIRADEVSKITPDTPLKAPRVRTRHLSVAELHKAYLNATIDLLEYEGYLARLGYDDDAIQIMVLDTLNDQKNDAGRKALADQRAADKAAKTKP